MDITFFLGSVLSVDNQAKDARGVNVPAVRIKSFLDGTTLNLPWVPIGPDQSMPMAGDTVLYYRYGSYQSRMVCFYGSNGDHIRKGTLGLNEGEAVWQSDSGKGYLKASGNGDMALVTGDMTSAVNGSVTGWDIKGPGVVAENYSGCRLELGEDGGIAMTKVDANGNVLASVGIDKDNNVGITVANGDVAIKAKNIMLDGNVFLGPGATDPQQRLGFGQAVSSGPTGTYPFETMSGVPVPGSGSVKTAR